MKMYKERNIHGHQLSLEIHKEQFVKKLCHDDVKDLFFERNRRFLGRTRWKVE
jgi:hypothetical protein